MTKERPWVKRSKTSNSFEKNRIFCMFLQFFPLFVPKSKSIPSLFAQWRFFKERPRANRSEQKSDREQFALVALFKRVTVSEPLSPLFSKEWPWAIHSGRSWQKSYGSDSLALLHKRIALAYFGSQKTSESLKKPMSKFPTLEFDQVTIEYFLRSRIKT